MDLPPQDTEYAYPDRVARMESNYHTLRQDRESKELLARASDVRGAAAPRNRAAHH